VGYDEVRARLNLYAVLPNLEDLVRHDPEARRLASGSNITIRFRVARGPQAWVRLVGGACTVGRGAPPHGADGAAAEVVLTFVSAAHLNKMFAGKGNPVPLKGFRHLGFLKNQFTQLTDRLSYFLKPNDVVLQDPEYLALNTRLTLNTAARAVPELVAYDPEARHFRSVLSSGSILLTVLPDGPSVSLLLAPSQITPVIGPIEHPLSLIRMGSVRIANAFLNGKMDTFTAVARGDVEIWGQIPKIDALSLVLDRIPKYLA
jgi:hypothetical protein